MKIYTAALSTETNTYVPLPTSATDFSVYSPSGSDSREGGGSTPHPCYDILRRRAAAEGFELAEGMGANAPPAGTVGQKVYEGFKEEILAGLRAALPVDGVVLGLHGAMVAHGYDDVEGDLLAAVRQLAGPAAVVAAELDPHSHLFQQRLDSADILIAYKEFPHIDVIERAEELIELTLRTIKKEIRPVMSAFDCRMIEVLPTSSEPMRSFVDRMMQVGQAGARAAGSYASSSRRPAAVQPPKP
eukprot:SAG22_NODE_520_length_9508_cov_1.914869_1_plen_244_part_00